MVGFGSKVTGVSAALAGLTAGVSAVAVASASIKKAMNFEAQFSTIQALTGATTGEMAKMESLALQMGASTKYSALEAGQGIEELLKAGLTPATVQAGGLEAALNLATAGGLGLADAAETMSTALNAFKKDGITAAQASNILAGTANASATGVEDLRQSLAAVSSIAAGVGLSFEDTNVALGLFANNGIKGSDAGTSLKTMLSNLQPTTKDQITLFKKLGLMTAKGSNAFYDTEGNIKSLEDISGTLRKSLGKLNNQQRALTLEMIFGSDAIRAGNILYDEGAAGVKKFQSEMSKVTALDVATKKMDNASCALEQLKGSVETLQITAAKPILPIIGDFAKLATKSIEKGAPQLNAAMEKSMAQLRTFTKKNYIDNPEFLALNFADKVGIVASDIKTVFDTWWDGGGKTNFEAVSANITKTLLSSLENSVDKITAIGLDLGVGLTNGIMDGMRQSKSLGWVFKGIDIATPGYIKDAWKAVGIDVGKKDPAQSIATASTGAASRAMSVGQNPPSFGPDYKGFSSSLNGKIHSNSGGISRVPYNGYTARLHRDEAVLPRSAARKHRNGGGSGGGVSVTGNTFIVRKDSDINEIATQLYRMINGADQAMGGA
jgi:TP901 family phage tail tape measure protein